MRLGKGGGLVVGDEVAVEDEGVAGGAEDEGVVEDEEAVGGLLLRLGEGVAMGAAGLRGLREVRAAG